MQELVQEPQGIGFFNINDGTTHFAKLEPTIAAYINSSDMGINASRGQDFGWRLAKEWVQRVRDFRRNTMQMQILTSQNSGQKPTTVQILYHLYGEELRAYQEELEEHEHPFEEQYQNDISEKRNAPAPTPVAEVATPSDEPTAPTAPSVPEDDGADDIASIIDDAMLEEGDPSDAAAEAATTDAPEERHVNRDAGDGQFVSDEEAKANPGTTVTETVKAPAKAKKPETKKTEQ